jgi:hypothetical protein
MPLPSHLQSMLLVRSLWIGVQHPELSHQQAKELAAEMLAEEEQERRAKERKQVKPRGKHDGGLIGKVMQMIERIDARQQRAAAPAPTPPPPPPTLFMVNNAEPAEPTTPTLGDKVAHAVRKLADAVGATQPEPEPTRPQPPMIRAEGSSAQVIPEHEYPTHLTSYALENWKRSIEANAEIQRAREARRRRNTGYLIG